LEELVRVVARLRAPDGCPWDRAQTLETLGHFLIEEAYEVRDVMAGEDASVHEEELGDLLFQIVLQSQLRQEQGAFSLEPVIRGITDKLVRRHPHVFGDEVVAGVQEVPLRPEPLPALRTEAQEAAFGQGGKRLGAEAGPRHVEHPDAQSAAAHTRDPKPNPRAGGGSGLGWEALKRAEGKGKGTLADVPRALPALMRAEKIGQRVARVGFDWPGIEGPLAKLDEEVAELREAVAAGDAAHIRHELGDVLFAAVNVARHAGVHPEEALAATNERFLRRYAHVEERLAESGRTPEGASLDELNALWDEAKRRHDG